MKSKFIQHRYIFLLLLAFSVVSCMNRSGQSDFQVTEGPPNIIIILVDDAGYVDFGFMGSGDPHSSLYWRKDKMAAARIGDHKLIRLDNYGFRMYDLENDLGEMNDLQAAQQEKFSELMSGLSAWEQGLIKPLWLEEDAWNKVTYEIHQPLMENREPKYTSPHEMRNFLEK